jgi:Family of unknown function (DUF6272)
MSELQFYKYYSEMSENKIDLAFKGPFSHQVLLSLADTLLGTIHRDPNPQKKAKKVFAIFIELTQNIRDYSYERTYFEGKEVGTGLILLQEFDDHYEITSCNLVEKHKVDKLIEYCKYLNAMDAAQLKAYYKTRIKEEDEKSNGGVGLISIARKSGRPFEFDMEIVNDKLSFFHLKISVEKE